MSVVSRGNKPEYSYLLSQKASEDLTALLEALLPKSLKMEALDVDSVALMPIYDDIYKLISEVSANVYARKKSKIFHSRRALSPF
ncbi:MAG: hypothetical protein HC817_07195 [Saprospiraceae bacterium]|nr:hypothetical protein [Saprospiraceae bacterium]